MSYNSGFGYIFSSDELTYLLGILGANYIIGVEEDVIASDRSIAERLTEKGYVHGSFDNEPILNMDVIEILKPMTNLSVFISLKCNMVNDSCTTYFYVNNNGVTVNEIHGISPSKHIISHFKEISNIYEIIIDKINISTKEETDANDKIIIDTKIIDRLRNMQSRTDLENCLINCEKSDKKIKFIVDFVCGTANIYTLVFFDDIKNKPLSMTSLMFANNNDFTMSLEAVHDKTTFNTVSKIQINEKIRRMLSACLHRDIETKSYLFK